jgi:hypothetical protein
MADVGGANTGKKALLEVHYSSESVLDRMKQVPEGNHSRTQVADGRFTTTDFETTLQRVERGWDGVTDKVSDFGDKLVHLMTNARPYANALEFGEDGDWVDVGKYLDGEVDECFASLVEGNPVPVRSLNMIVNITCNYHVNASAMQMRGAALAYLVDWFRANGVNINLWAVMYTENITDSEGHDQNTLHLHRIDTAEGYSLNQLASYIALPDFMRRVGFGIEELMMNLPSCTHSAYGQAREFIVDGKAKHTVPREAIDILGGEEAIAKALYFGCCSNDWDDIDYTVDTICKIIDDFNGVNKREEVA